MAQRSYRSGTHRIRAFSSRLGLRARMPYVVAALVLMACAVAFAALRAQGGFELMRGIEQGAEETASGGDASGGLEPASEAGAVAQEGGSDSAAVASDEPTADADDAGAREGPAGPALLAVHVDGAVAEPGVYRVPAGSRAMDAVELAGGLRADADTRLINLAAPLEDGAKVYVPREGETPAEGAIPAEASAAAPAEGGTTALINVNTATIEELQTLVGIGEATARAIIEEREGSGPFASVDDLLRVSGIGEKKLAKIRDHVCV